MVLAGGLKHIRSIGSNKRMDLSVFILCFIFYLELVNSGKALICSYLIRDNNEKGM